MAMASPPTSAAVSDGPAPDAAAGRYLWVSELADRVAEDFDLEQEIRKDPVRALHRHAAPTSDRWGDRWGSTMLMVILGAIAAGVIVATGIFAVSKITVPPELIALGSAALGGLVGSRLRP